MHHKTIITCAITGNLVTREQHPGLPITPIEIAEAAIGAARAGAAIVHLHVRDPSTGRPSMELDLYREVVDRIRSSPVDVIINLTTGEGGRFVPSSEDPRIAGDGTTLVPPELRVAHVIEIKPEICSLDFNTMWSGKAAVINSPQSITRMAQLIQSAGVKPELEVFDTSDILLAADLFGSGSIQPENPPFFQIVLGVKYGAKANPRTLDYMKSLLPSGSVWSAFGIGRFEYPTLASSFLLGGHVRVGMEDNIFIRKGELCRDNAQLVEKAKQIIELLGGELASPDEARSILNLRKAT